mmetsp:Transcript_35448/g.92286  ORF Transcript_35448/g.92286 Transcript_35448/m.92286 type:complete len:488 (-) Transcript_35448:249-1712(-)
MEAADRESRNLSGKEIEEKKEELKGIFKPNRVPLEALEREGLMVCKNCCTVANAHLPCPFCRLSQAEAEAVLKGGSDEGGLEKEWEGMERKVVIDGPLPVGYCYNEVWSTLHRCTDDSAIAPIEERPDRTLSIHSRLSRLGLLGRKEVVRTPLRKASAEEVAAAHSPSHLPFLLEACANGTKRITEHDTFVCEETGQVALEAAGAVIEVVRKVAKGELRESVAIVRPPGHHACSSAVMGFCMLNNVAIAARSAQLEPGINRVMIVDWDIHHCNGTQDIFEHDPSVLVLSLHRYGDGFYPGTGHEGEVGKGKGEGKNVNLGWRNPGMGDVEYIAAFKSVFVPLARSFQPDLILVSSGFDAAEGDPLGLCKVTPAGYAQLAGIVAKEGRGKTAFILEGGYNLNSISRSAEAVMRAVLGEEVPVPLMAEDSKALLDRADERGAEDVFKTIRSIESFWRDINFGAITNGRHKQGEERRGEVDEGVAKLSLA